MRTLPAACAVLALLTCAAPASASDEIFRKKNCMACHAVDQKKLGPSLKEIAARYHGDKAVTAALAKRIRAGGSGAWGQLPMPPQPQVSEAEATSLAEYILSLK